MQGLLEALGFVGFVADHSYDERALLLLPLIGDESTMRRAV